MSFIKQGGKIYEEVTDTEGYRADLLSQVDTVTSQIADLNMVIDNSGQAKIDLQSQLKDLQYQISSLDIVAPEK